MTDAVFTTSRPSMRRHTRFWPIEHLAEISFFFIILLMTVRLGPMTKFSTLGWLACVGIIVVVRRKEFAAVLLRWWPLLLAPALATASYAWSEAPDIALKYGAQFLITAFTGVLVARCIPPTRFISTLFAAVLVFCVLSVASGRQGISAEGMVLIGLTGSKNQMSSMGFILTFSAFATLVNPLAPRILRLAALPGLAIGGYVVAVTASATGVLVSIGCIGAMAIICLMQRFTPAGRVGLLLALLLVASPIALLAPEIERGMNDFLINVLHKDPGLTGRDYLWARADELIAMKPILGHGFQAIWLGSTSETTGLLRWAGITDGRTFNFHNTYRQFAVDTGFVGLTIWVVTLAVALLAGLKQLTIRPSVAIAFCVVFAISNIARMYTEMLLVAFSTQTALVFSFLTYCFWRSQPGWNERSAVEPVDPYAYDPPLAPAPHPLTPQYRLERHALRAPAPQDPPPRA